MRRYMANFSLLWNPKSTLLLLSGPVLAAVVFTLAPDSQEHGLMGRTETAFAARFCLAVAVWMAIWWITEAVPLALTALIPIFTFPLLQIRPFLEIAKSYFHPIVILFLGGFIISIALQKWRLDRRFALFVLRIFGTSQHALVGGMMIATAGLSMWISNTATTIMMLPIALSLIATNQFSDGFARCILLAIAYSASIGGVATIIGTPPNTFVASYLRDVMGQDVGFLQWMQVGAPLAAIFLLLCWTYLVFVRYPQQHEVLSESVTTGIQGKTERFGFPQWATLVVFGLVAAGWLTRRGINAIEIAGNHPFDGVGDAHIAMCGAVLLFLIPSTANKGPRLLNIKDLVRVPWATLVLFGGGLALATTIKITGADQIIGSWLASFPKMTPLIILALCVSFVVFMTELTSNIATTATMVPILAASAQIFGLEATTIIVASAFSASCAFMLPVATPPNAIVYGSGRIPSREMARAGFTLNIAGIFLITAMMHFWFDGFSDF